ncbi:MAG: hypothetical protein Tsb009_13360 [Planctomycetaceae bacterium]
MSDFHDHSGRDVYCPHCHVTFRVPSSMSGGFANCPECQKAVEVGGGHEPLFWMLVGAGVVGILLFAGLAFWAGGLLAGGVVLTIGAIIMGIVLLAM